MNTKLTTALAILLLAGASGAALAQDRDHGDRGQSAPQSRPQPQQGGPQGGGQPRPQGGPRGPGGGDHAGPPPGAFRGPQERGPQAPSGGQPRFNHEAAPGAVPRLGPGPGPGVGPGPGAPRQFDRDRDRDRGQRDVIPQGAGRGREFTPGARPDGGRPEGRGDGRFDGRADGRFDGRGGRDGHVEGRPDGRFDGHNPLFGGWRGAPSHWQAGRYPSVMWSHDRFRAGYYRPPYGYYSRAWVFGDFLPQPWFARDYWLDDFLDFDLPYPPPGFVWVRVGPDALMIDRFTGRVVQVVRGIFW